MNAETASSGLGMPSTDPRPQVSHRERFEWAVALLSAWWVVGLYLDGWAHVNGLPESFFTPWHGVLYSGILGTGLVLGAAAGRARRGGAAWRSVLPRGHGLSLIGVLSFLAAGVADMLWHTAFGIEVGLEALYSPPHLLLAGSGVLIATGPLRSAWHQDVATPARSWRAVLSTTLALAILTFFTSESNPVTHPWASARFRPLALDADNLGLPGDAAGGLGAPDLIQTLGISGIIIQSGLVVALLLLLIVRWGAELPLGWLTFTLGVSGISASVFHSTLIAGLPLAITGVAADALYRWWRPDAKRPSVFRRFGAAVPVVLYAFYFAVLLASEDVWWPPNVWLGSIVFGGATGLLVSYLLLPPALPRSPLPRSRGPAAPVEHGAAT